MPRAPKKIRPWTACMTCTAIAKSLGWQNPTPYGEERTVFRAKQLHWKGIKESWPLCFDPSRRTADPDPSEQQSFA